MVGIIKKMRIGILVTTIALAGNFAMGQEIKNLWDKRAFYISSEEDISSGEYSIGTDKQKLMALNLPFIYNFDTDGKINPYISASIGYAIDQNKTTNAWFQHLAYKIGGGAKYSFNDTSSIRFGGAYGQLIRFGGVSKEYFRSRAKGYEIDALYSYHPQLGLWKPYLLLGIRSKRSSFGNENKNSLVSKVKIGFLTPTFAELYGIGISGELYAERMVLSGDMQKSLDSNYLNIIGAKIFIATPIEFVLGAKYIKGERTQGVDIGLGVKF